MEADLRNYFLEEKRLVEKIRSNKLNCLEAQNKCKELWKLVTINILINPYTLNNLMEEKYSQSPDWKYSKKFEVNIKDL
jgi:hypothetical protein